MYKSHDNRKYFRKTEVLNLEKKNLSRHLRIRICVFIGILDDEYEYLYIREKMTDNNFGFIFICIFSFTSPTVEHVDWFLLFKKLCETIMTIIIPCR